MSNWPIEEFPKEKSVFEMAEKPTEEFFARDSPYTQKTPNGVFCVSECFP